MDKGEPDFLLESISDDVRSTFTQVQIGGIRRAAEGRRAQHLLDIRVSVPMPFGRRWYLAVRAGRERRSAARLASEG